MTGVDCGGRWLDLSVPQVMGVVNVTPDSFSDGGKYVGLNVAIDHAQAMAADGAVVIDVGGESTRPGANPVPESQELDRILPVIEALSAELDIPVSVDTMKPAVMRAAAKAGAGMINDVNALREDGALEAAADSGLAVCLMHMQGTPQTMQQNPRYSDVVWDVRRFLQQRLVTSEAAGIPANRLLIDPGFGFGKTHAHNARLLAGLAALSELDAPLAVGLSRKGFLGQVTGRSVEQRIPAGIAAATLAARAGARLVRAHDVAATVDALRLVGAVERAAMGA